MLQCLEEVCLRDQKVPASTRAQSLLVPERSLQRPVDKDMLDIFGLNDDDDAPAFGGAPADLDATPPE